MQHIKCRKSNGLLDTQLVKNLSNFAPSKAIKARIASVTKVLPYLQ